MYEILFLETTRQAYSQKYKTLYTILCIFELALQELINKIQ